MKKIVIPASLALCLFACSEAPVENKNPIDGRAYSYDKSIWTECTQNNDMMALKLEYEDYLSHIGQEENEADSKGEHTVFQKHCKIINDNIWCEKDSNAYHIMSTLLDDVSSKLSRCCFEANGNYFKQLPDEKYLTFIGTSTDEDDQEEGLFDQLFGEEEEESKSTTPVLSETKPANSDKKVVSYKRDFSTELFGTCMAK